MMEPFGRPEISDRDFQRFAELLSREAGIQLPPHKKPLLISRIASVMRTRNIPTYRGYFELIVADRSGAELTTFIDLLSTNVTHFFRESKHFEYLTELLKAGAWADEPSVQIWSAACSTGEEPYSIALCLEASLPPGQSYSILASDISTKALKVAERGVYPMDRVDGISLDLLRKGFQKGRGKAEGMVRVRNAIREHVQFRQLNLMEDLPFRKQFHVIFCRNVMIYFNTRDKETLVNRFAECLKPEGCLLIGHAESLNGMNHPYTYVRPATYRLHTHA
jgi:chemotaxis protein methyltransferase CheR